MNIKKQLRKILSTMVVFAMMIGFVTPVKADSVPETDAPYIYKNLIMAEGISTPEAEFTFDFTSVKFSYTGGSTDESSSLSGGIPSISSVSIEYDANEAQPAADSSGLVTIRKGAAITLPTYSAAGVYTYKITEATTGFTPTEKVTSSSYYKDEMIYSLAEYTMLVYVVNNANGGFDVKGVTINKDKEDNGSTSTDGKVDGGEDKNNTGGELEFANVYKKIANSEETPTTPDPQNPSIPMYESLTIEKEVAGEYALLTDTFDFTVYFTASVTETGNDIDKTYKYYILGADGTTKKDKDGNVITTGALPTTSLNNTSLSFELGHGEKIIFLDLPSGTKYYATEAAASNYAASASVKDTIMVETSSGSGKYLADQGTWTTDNDGSVNTKLVVSKDKSENKNILIGEKINEVVVKNTHKDISITGVIIENLPFIALAGLGILGLAFLVVSKKRKEARFYQ